MGTGQDLARAISGCVSPWQLAAKAGRGWCTAKVIDGDTIVLAGELVRLHGNDDPELDQPFWWRGSAGDDVVGCPRALIAGAKVRCEAVERDRHGLALRWTRLSCHAFLHNAVSLQLFALAYTLANFLRRLVLPNEVARSGR